MEQHSKKQWEEAFEKIKKLYDCYAYIYQNAENETSRKRIFELARNDILMRIDAIFYGVDIPLRRRIEALRKQLNELSGQST